MERSALFQPVDNEAEKTVTAAAEIPAEVFETGNTYAYLPGMTPEPAEFVTDRPLQQTTGRITEAADFIDDSSGVEKCMEVFPVSADSLFVLCDFRVTLPAAQNFFMLLPGVFLVVFG